MNHDLSELQALANEGRATDPLRIREVCDEGVHAHRAGPRVRQVLGGAFGSDRTTSGVVPKTEYAEGSWYSRGSSGGMKVIGIGATAQESVNNFWRKWEEV